MRQRGFGPTCRAQLLAALRPAALVRHRTRCFDAWLTRSRAPRANAPPRLACAQRDRAAACGDSAPPERQGVHHRAGRNARHLGRQPAPGEAPAAHAQRRLQVRSICVALRLRCLPGAERCRLRRAGYASAKAPRGCTPCASLPGAPRLRQPHSVMRRLRPVVLTRANAAPPPRAAPARAPLRPCAPAASALAWRTTGARCEPATS